MRPLDVRIHAAAPVLDHLAGAVAGIIVTLVPIVIDNQIDGVAPGIALVFANRPAATVAGLFIRISTLART